MPRSEASARTATVWVVQSNSKHDVTPAMQYGRIQSLLPAHDLNVDAQGLYKYLYDGLKESHKNDWLILSGDPCAIACAAVIWESMHRELRVLKWDRRANTYVPFKV